MTAPVVEFKDLHLPFQIALSIDGAYIMNKLQNSFLVLKGLLYTK